MAGVRSPYEAPQKESLASRIGTQVKSGFGIGSKVRYSKSVKKALIGIPESDEQTRTNEFKNRYRLISHTEGPGGGSTAGPDGEPDKPGHGGIEDTP